MIVLILITMVKTIVRWWYDDDTMMIRWWYDDDNDANGDTGDYDGDNGDQRYAYDNGDHDGTIIIVSIMKIWWSDDDKMMIRW